MNYIRKTSECYIQEFQTYDLRNILFSISVLYSLVDFQLPVQTKTNKHTFNTKATFHYSIIKTSSNPSNRSLF